MDEIRPWGNNPPYIHESDAVQVEAREATTNIQICGYFSNNPDYTAGCASSFTCSTPSGGKSWGCCDETSCYIPATCEDASAPDCGGTAASLCPKSPIMKCTYGASSRCLYFIYKPLLTTMPSLLPGAAGKRRQHISSDRYKLSKIPIIPH
ncbi:hypothetical protein BKA59DRAFT_122726 [Fusarium tricinctum]|uniref:Uncharacterized protein n=1 Tax=Fusarium tricinctum TaxID=61284 RepID=A0A8K0RYR9_9HYPO|nr:hypothetical protein BKA59DRAFT_122726 [Fusarium tricinctum]